MTDDRDALARLIRDAIDARYNDPAAPYNSAYLMDGDVLDSQFIEGHIDLLNVAAAVIAAGWVPRCGDYSCIHADHMDHAGGRSNCEECGARVGHYSKCPSRVPGVILNNQPEPLSTNQDAGDYHVV